jgi:predicted regulator of Ras-like GTPase activity (Roadblock/LC7/MglB family)
MDAAQALRELSELSVQVTGAVVLDAEGAIVASTGGDDGRAEALAEAARGLVAAAGELHAGADEVTRAEVELSEGALFVLREGGLMIAATTGPQPTAGLVAYDLRTCLRSIESPAPRRRRTPRRKAEEV